jgi:gliding motility-associated-like protein
MFYLKNKSPMLKPFLPIFIILFLGISAMAQIPEQLTGINPSLGTRSSLAPCTGAARSGRTTQTLGTTAKTKNKLFLCAGDTMYVSNTGSNLSEDPKPSTTAGIGYFFYNCPPSVSGARWSDVVKDGCLRTTNIAGQISPTTARGDVTGRDTFFNNGGLQTAFNAGKPLQLWFSSATIYDFFKLDAEGDTACVNVGNVASGTPLDTFSVVYLNPVRISNLTYATRGGSFKIEGGLPEYNVGSNYALTIIKTTDPTKVGTITGSLTHGSTLTFTVPEDGSYTIKGLDGVSCDATVRVTFPSLSLTISNETVANRGDIACVKLTTTGFTNVGSIQLYMTYNPAIIKYNTIRNINPALTGFSLGRDVNVDKDTINVTWLTSPLGVTLPPNSTLFEVCFNTIGPIGSSSPVKFFDPEIDLNTLAADPNDSRFRLDTIQGSVRIGSAPISVRYAVDSTNCNKDSTGRIRIIPTGTGAPFSYAWQSRTSPLLNGSGTMAVGDTGKIIKLAAGTYFLTVTDVNNSSRNDTLEVKEPSALLANFALIVNTCLDSSRGSLEIAAAGGTAPYTYVWNTGAITKKIINLPQGPYSCIITDAKGCSTRVASDIIATPIQVANRTLTPAKCTGANIKTGSVTILGVTGGSPPSGNYTFTWNTTPVATQTGATAAITNLDPGLYKVTISDGNCTGKDSFLVAAERTVEVTAAISNVTCNGASTATILATASSRGTVNPPYVFRWTGVNAPDIISAPATSLASKLKAGKYPLSIQDQDGCKVDSTFTITEPSAIRIKVDTLRNESCLTGGDGLIGITASGGTVGAAGYTYQWSRSAADNKPIISNLFAGSYKVEIRDEAACLKDTTFIITVPKKPTLTLAIKNATCFGKQDGSARVIVTPPAGALVTGITWSNSFVTDIITPVKPDTYRVVVALNNGCLKDTFAVVGSPAPFMVDTVLSKTTNPTCPTFNDGQINLIMKGGTAPYVYTWSGGQPQAQPVFGSLFEGVYKFTVKDFNECTVEPNAEVTIALVAPPDIKVSYLDIVGTKCYGKCVLNRSDGKATATAMGGPANTGIYTFLWSSGESTSRAIELCGGIQTVIVSDGVCSKKDTVIIPEPLPFTFSTPVIEEPSCKGLKDGKAQVLLTGGTPPYAYNWTTGSTTNDIVNVTAGTYAVVVTDANQCAANPLSIAINEPQSLKLDTLKDATNDVTCFGFSDGKITLQRKGGNGGATVYTWTNNVSQTNLADKLKAGIYYVTATDRKGCKDSLSFTIKQPDKIYYFLEPPVSPRCYGELTYIKVDTAFGSTYAFPFTVSVDNGPQYPIGFQVPVFADNHLVTITEQITGCSDTVSVSISQPPPITVRFADIVDSVPTPRILIGLGMEVRLNPIITGALPIDSVSWTPKDYLKFTNEPLRPLIRPLDDKTYKLKVTDVNGCVGLADLLVELERNRNVYIPNVFSPNGDDKNDFFGTFSGVGVKSVNYMRIFDRWGELIFQAENLAPSGDPSAGWDGTFRGKPVSTGVYVYIVEVSFEDGAKLLYRGDITVAR